jgi:phage tail-like protein
MIVTQEHTPHPLRELLPGIFQDDELMLQLCAAADAVLAPAITMLDCFPAYLDPATTPPDLLDWLVDWLDLAAVRGLPVERRRVLLGNAGPMQRHRGTPEAVRELMEQAGGFPVELEESGGSGWSRQAGAVFPGHDRPGVTVRIITGEAEMDDLVLDSLRRLLANTIPAHLPWTLELER